MYQKSITKSVEELVRLGCRRHLQDGVDEMVAEGGDMVIGRDGSKSLVWF